MHSRMQAAAYFFRKKAEMIFRYASTFPAVVQMLTLPVLLAMADETGAVTGKNIVQEAEGNIGMQAVMRNDVEITTMCAVFHKQKALMLNRVKSWKGWAFPGGHLESGESITDCIKRELLEETGIVVTAPIFKGIANIYNTLHYKRHIIYHFVCYEYSGNVKDSCDEGEIRWIDISEMKLLAMAEGMEYRIPLFLEDKRQELYIEWDEEHGYTKVTYSEM